MGGDKPSEAEHTGPRETFILLNKKKLGSRLDVLPFFAAYAFIIYQTWEELEEEVYPKFLLLITFFLHGMIFLVGNWKTDWKIHLHYTKTLSVEDCQEIFVSEISKDGTVKQDIVPKETDEQTGKVVLHFQKKKYVYDAQKKEFIRVRPPVNIPLEHFRSGMESPEYRQGKDYDPNLLDFPMPNFMKIFKEQVVDPLNFFQLFSMALYFLDGNIFHPLLTMFMVLISIFSVAVDRMTTMMNLRSLILKPQFIYVYREGRWTNVNSGELRPGDIVSVLPSNKVKEISNEMSEDDTIDQLRKNIPFGDKIPKGMIMKMYQGGKNECKPVLPCDLVVLAGNCIVDESILTGESVPLTKDSVLNDLEKGAVLNIQGRHKSNALFCGTEVLQSFASTTLPAGVKSFAPDNGCIAYVLKTGFDTAKGKLSRSVIYNNENIALKNNEAFILLGMLLILSIVASAYVLNEGLKDESRDKQKLFLRCILIITSVVPPELPMITNISINTSLLYLRRKRIFCTEPGRIPLAGRLDVCAFDKTGTLTTDKLEVKGVCVDCKTSKILPDLNSAIAEEASVGIVLGGCNTVVTHEGQLLGDPIEKLFFEQSSWRFNSSIRMSFDSKRSSRQVSIKFNHPFRSDIKRMSSVAKVDGIEGYDGHYALVKGAPEVVGALLANKPDNYDKCAFGLMKEGYRVLCLAYKKLPSYDPSKVIERDLLERDLLFAGLLILSCPMKKDTPDYIKVLKKAGFRNIMITGDNMFTAAKTGQDLDFGSSKNNLFLREDTSSSKLAWYNFDDKLHAELKLGELSSLSKDFTLCVEGPELSRLFDQDRPLMQEVIQQTTIFARVSPDQKELIVKELKEKNLKVLMCGDGTNDVGALKKADVGIALVGTKEEPDEAIVKAEREEKQKKYQEALKTRNFAAIKELNKPVEDVSEFKTGDACIAAPFTNKYTNSLKCVITVIRQGVCTMCTAIQTYRILTLQSLIYAYTMSTLHLENLKTSDAQNTCMGVFGAYFFYQLSNSKPVKKISPIKPETTIFNIPFWMSVIGQAAILLIYMRVCLHYSKEYSLPEDLKVTNDSEDAEFKPTFRASMMFLYELTSMFCISIFNHEGEPFMQSLVAKSGHFKFIMMPLGIVLLVTLDMSEFINEILQINLKTKDEFEDGNLFFCYLLTSMVLLLYGWTRMIKYLRFKNTFGWL